MPSKTATILILVLAFAGSHLGCDHGKDTAHAQSQNSITPVADASPTLSFPPESGPLPTFDGNRAMQYVKEIVALGPRPIGSANHKKVEDYLASRLKGDQIKDDVFTADTPEGKFPVHHIIAKSC